MFVRWVDFCAGLQQSPVTFRAAAAVTTFDSVSAAADGNGAPTATAALNTYAAANLVRDMIASSSTQSGEQSTLAS
jgi:hypothetical protein